MSHYRLQLSLDQLQLSFDVVVIEIGVGGGYAVLREEGRDQRIGVAHDGHRDAGPRHEGTEERGESPVGDGARRDEVRWFTKHAPSLAHGRTASADSWDRFARP